MTARLVSDRAGPLRRPGDVDLHDAVRAAHTALDTPAQSAHELARLPEELGGGGGRRGGLCASAAALRVVGRLITT